MTRIKIVSIEKQRRYAIYAAIERGHLKADKCDGLLCVDSRALTAWQRRGYRKQQDARPRRVGQYRGVYLDKNKDLAPYFTRCHDEYLGYYDTPEDAAMAYDEWALSKFGDKAITNFPPEVVREKPRIHKGGARRDNITGIRGVNWHAKRQQYRARIGYKGISYHLGWFDDPHDAALAYNEKAIEFYGDKAQLNAVSGGGESTLARGACAVRRGLS